MFLRNEKRGHIKDLKSLALGHWIFIGTILPGRQHISLAKVGDFPAQCQHRNWPVPYTFTLIFFIRKLVRGLGLTFLKFFLHFGAKTFLLLLLGLKLSYSYSDCKVGALFALGTSLGGNKNAFNNNFLNAIFGPGAVV